MPSAVNKVDQVNDSAFLSTRQLFRFLGFLELGFN